MPTYEYKCSGCNYLFEHFQSMTTELLTECPKCGGILKRVIGAGAGPIFKGSGFYQTDYKGKSPQSKNSNAGDVKPESSDKKVDKESK